MRLKVVAYVVAILLVTACGSSSTAARATAGSSPSPSTSASPTAASPSSSPVQSPTPSPSTAPVTPYAVLATQPGADTYSVSLVAASGAVVASAQPTSPTTVTCGDGSAAVLPLPVSTTHTRVYFLDQQGNVNFLTPNGETGHASHVPAGGSIRSMFAVSPDDQRIAVVENTYTSSGTTTVLYVEDLNGGGNHVQPFKETGAFTLWPIGWHGTNNLVLAKMPACSSGSGIGATLNELHVVDPTTAVRRSTLGGAQCLVVGSPSPAGAVCENASYTQAIVLSWTGATVRSITIQGPQAAYLSPDGSTVALVNNNVTTFEGIKQTLDLLACGWIDNTHVIAGGDSQQQARIGDVTNGSLAPVAAPGVCGGRIPGDL